MSVSMEVWACEKAALVGGISVLRDRVRLLSKPEAETDIHEIGKDLFLFRTNGFDWDSAQSEGPWVSAVVLQSYGHRLSVRSTCGNRVETVELKNGDILTMNIREMHKLRRPRGGSHENLLFTCAFLPHMKRKPSREKTEKGFLQAFARMG
jgi:hypothetical protein